MAFAVSISTGKPDRLELDCINEIIAAATYTWNLPKRVKRLSLPLYQYLENDLEHMQFLLAEAGDFGFIGLAALEEVDEPDGPDGQNTWLLHGLYVYPGHHRQGVGSRLIESAEAVSKAKGVAGLLVRAQAEAQPFFAKRGYSKLPIEDGSRDYAHRYWKAV